MATRLIELDSGVFVEIEAAENEVHQCSSKMADKVKNNLDKIKPILLQVSQPLIEVWHELDKEMFIDQAEITLGLNFEGQGNIYITKAKAGANINVKLTLKPKE